MSAPVSTYAPFVDCPSCKGHGWVPTSDWVVAPLSVVIESVCEDCDGTGRKFEFSEYKPKRYIPAVTGKQLLWIMGFVALIFAGFVYVTRAWEWWMP